MIRSFLPMYTILLREFILFYRQKGRLAGALLQPFLFWICVGTGLNSALVRLPNQNVGYLEYFFPGILLIVILFTSIFSTIGIIEDRKAGFLQEVVVSPAPRWSIALGRVLGGTILGLAQGSLFLLLAYTPLMAVQIHPAGLVLLLFYMALVGFGLTALGVIVAWAMDSVQGYHAVMSVVLFPLWMFSGAVFPMAGTPPWLYWMMRFNPLTHGLELMRACLYAGADVGAIFAGANGRANVYLLVSCAVSFVVANWMVGKRR